MPVMRLANIACLVGALSLDFQKQVLAVSFVAQTSGYFSFFRDGLL